jgi:hypothetical protein
MKPAEFRVGAADHLGRRVDQIYSVEEGYVIYLTSNAVACFIDDAHLPKAERTVHARFVQLAPDLSRLYALQPGRLWRKESINRQLARALGLCLEGNNSAARDILGHVERRLAGIRRIEGRLQYQFTCLAVVTIVLGFLFGASRHFPNATPVLSAIGSGLLGGFFSVSLGLSRIQIEAEATWLANAMAAFSRLSIAAVAAIFAYYGVKAKIIFGNLDANSNAILPAIAMLSGFSETFVPNVLRSLQFGEASAGAGQATPGEGAK